MEFEDLEIDEGLSDEELIKIGERIARAFGLDEIEDPVHHAYGVFFVGFLSHPTPTLERVEMQFGVLRPNGELDFVFLNPHVSVERKPDSTPEWDVSYTNPHLHSLMIRGLVRIGIQDKYVFDQLELHITAHEKLELRLSMPREFWPKTWLEEERE